MFDFDFIPSTPSTPQDVEPPTAFQAAITSGDVDTVRQLVSTEEPSTVTNALCEACEKGDLSVIEVLLTSERADINGTLGGNTPLFLAAQQVQPEAVKLLLDHGADWSNGPNASNNSATRTPLHGLFGNIRHSSSRDTEYTDRVKETATLLLSAGCDINEKDDRGETVLHMCLHHSMPMVEMLLEHGADPNAVDSNGNTPLHRFHSPLQYPSMFISLMAGGAKLDIRRSADGCTALHVFASRDQLGDLSLFRPHVADWSVTDARGNTVLHIAVQNHLRDRRTLPELLSVGLDPRQTNKDGEQPIHLISGQRVSVKNALDVLCAAGADLEARDHQGRTLLLKQMSGHPSYNSQDILKYLISRGANINAQDYKGNGLLHYIVRPYVWKSEYLDFLLSIGADPSLANFEGDNVLHRLAANFATISDDTALVAIKKLLGSGLSPVRPNYKGQTPLHLLCSWVSEHCFSPAAEGGKTAIDMVMDAGLGLSINTADNQGVLPIHLAVTISEALVSLLIARGADTVSPTNDGRNLLHIACTARQSNIVGLLLEHYQSLGVKDSLLNARSKDGRTPLHVASRSGRPETVSLLLEHGASVDIEDDQRRWPIDACAEFPAEDRLWTGDPEDHNLFTMLHAAGVEIDDDQRPRQPSSKRKTKNGSDVWRPRKIGWRGEITSELFTVGVKGVIRALASNGALAINRESGPSVMFHAISSGCEAMIEELDRVSRAQGLVLEKYQTLETKRYLLRSQHLPEILTNQFKESFSVHHVVNFLLLEHEEEIAQAIENNAEAFETDSSMAEIIVVLARWGYHGLLRRIAGAMSDLPCVNIDSAKKLGRPLIPCLLAAAERELPNLEVIKILVEQFHVDVNVQFVTESATIPHVYYESKMASRRHYKGGDTILHHLAQGGCWWYEGAIKYLLQHGADPNIRNVDGKTPLCYAVTRSDLGGYRQKEITRILLEGGADPNIPAHCGYTPLAMATHDTQLYELLVQYGARPSVDHPMEMFCALYSFNIDVLSSLISRSLNCNSVFLSDAQPHWHTFRVRKMQNPNPNIYPLHYISMLPFNEENSRNHAIRMVKCLLANGADPFLQFDDEYLILHEIFAGGGIIQPWLDMPDLDLERRDCRGRTLLLAAASCGVGVDSYACTLSVLPFRGGRLLTAPWLKGDPTRAMALYERGADLTAVDSYGQNVLHKLGSRSAPSENAEFELRRTVALFVEKAPDLVLQKDLDGNIPLDLARAKGVLWATDLLSLSSTK